MQRREPTPEHRPGKYDSIRDEALHLMTLELWGNESDGSAESVTGFFSRICISEAELFEVVQAFKDELETAGLTEPESLVGNWIVTEDETGLVTVDQYDTEQAATAIFHQRSLAHGEWMAGTA